MSAGTYIRAVARDLAERCGSVAHLSSLRRVAIGSIEATQAHAPTTFAADMLIPPHHVSRLNPRCLAFTVPECYQQRIANGEPPAQIEYFHSSRFSLSTDQCALLFAEHRESNIDDDLLAICAYREKQLRYLYVRPNECAILTDEERQ